MTSGPIDEASADQAVSTSEKTERGASKAIPRTLAVMLAVATRCFQYCGLSPNSLRSSVMAAEHDSTCESAVEMVDAKIPARTRPIRASGSISMAKVGSASSGSKF